VVTNRECDVLVIGGGAAGIAAAVAASRSGATVVLVERYGFLGGLATAGMVGTICGLYHRSEDSQPRYVCGGFVHEWAEHLAQRSASKPVYTAGGLWVLPYNSWAFQRLADQIIGDLSGLELILHGTLTAVKTQHRQVKEIEILVWDKMTTLRSQCIVDCTGDGTVIYLAGGSITENPSQAAGILFTMSPVDGGLQTTGERVAVLRAIAKRVGQGKLDPACRQVSFVQSAEPDRGVSLKLSFADCSDDPLRKMTALELRGRELVDQLSDFLPFASPAFKKARLSRVATQVGIRIGRTIRGQVVLDETDVLECRKFSDGVACSAWPIEEWNRSDQRPRMSYLPVGQHYEIPLRCLISEEFDNVFAAGRCISATERALCSARVIGTALATGWAAGVAAALRADDQPLSTAIQRIRERQVPGRV
jgi:hypothetical protein